MSYPRSLSCGLVLSCLAALSAVAVFPVAPRTAWAYQDDDEAFSAPVVKNPAAKRADDSDPAVRSFLGWMIRASGLVGFLILLAAFVLAALIVLIALQLQRENYLPASVIEQVEQKLNAKDYHGAFETAKAGDSFIGRLLAAGLARLRDGYDAAEAGMQEIGDEEALSMEQKIGYLSLIGSIAPLLGLLGTVQGLVMSFQAIAASPVSPKSHQLSDGIATALFTTLEGLIVAIPAMFFFTLFKNRLARLLMESGHVVDHLMGRFRRIGQPAAPHLAAGTTAASSAVPLP